MEAEDSRLLSSTNGSSSVDARERLQAIMTNEMAEAIEEIGQTLEACQTKKNRLLDRLEEVYQAVEAVRNECNCIDTTIANRVLHLNKLVTQIVKQIAHIHIPDPPPPPPPIPKPQPPPKVEIDLAPVHEQLNSLSRTVTELSRLLREKEDTLLYVINKRSINGKTVARAHAPIRGSEIQIDRDQHRHLRLDKIPSLMRHVQHEEHRRSKNQERQNILKHIKSIQKSFHHDDETNVTNGNPVVDDIDVASHSSDQTTIGPYSPCLTDEIDEAITNQLNAHQSVSSTNFSEHASAVHTLPIQNHTTFTNSNKHLGEALASNGVELAYYDYAQEMICTVGADGYSIKFQHGLVVDLYWWSLNNEWLILSERGLYRWKPGDREYHKIHSFTKTEIRFRRIAASATSIFCVFRHSVMLLELSKLLQTKCVYGLTPPENHYYDKLGDGSIRKFIRPDGSEEEVLGKLQTEAGTNHIVCLNLIDHLGLIWFGNQPGILLEERFINQAENNLYERSFRHVAVREGRYARLAPYNDGKAWLISNIGEDIFCIVDNTAIVADRWEARSTWVKVNNGIPINAVGYTNSTVCVRFEDGSLEYLEAISNH